MSAEPCPYCRGFHDDPCSITRAIEEAQKIPDQPLQYIVKKADKSFGVYRVTRGGQYFVASFPKKKMAREWIGVQGGEECRNLPDVSVRRQAAGNS